MQRIAEPDIDVPVPLGVVDRREAGDHEHQVVGEVIGRRLGAVHATDVVRDVVTQRRQQPGERPVEVEAIATAPTEGDALHR